MFEKKEVYQKKQKICYECKYYKNGICTECGCVIALKIRLKEASCRIGKW